VRVEAREKATTISVRGEKYAKARGAGKGETGEKRSLLNEAPPNVEVPPNIEGK
jgi:hypothetical protein